VPLLVRAGIDDGVTALDEVFASTRTACLRTLWCTASTSDIVESVGCSLRQCDRVASSRIANHGPPDVLIQRSRHTARWDVSACSRLA
jgi:hypothetical protein